MLSRAMRPHSFKCLPTADSLSWYTWSSIVCSLIVIDVLPTNRKMDVWLRVPALSPIPNLLTFARLRSLIYGASSGALLARGNFTSPCKSLAYLKQDGCPLWVMVKAEKMEAKDICII